VVIEYHELHKYLPHRHPFLLIDRIVEIEAFKRAVSIKNVTGSEYFFPGHFPGKPVMPGVLIVEAMAQTGAALAIYSNPDNEGALTYFAGIDNTRFKKQVVPGDTIRMELDVIRGKGRVWKIKGRAFVGQDMVCECELMAVIESAR